MIKEDYYVDVDIVNNKMIRHYRDKGYDFVVDDTIKVRVTDLPHASRKEVMFICDYCGEEFTMVLKNRNNNMKKKIIKKDSCKECSCKNKEATNLIKYGVKNPFQNEEIQQKHRDTLVERYGVEHISQIEGVREKAKSTMIERYGVESYTQSEEYLAKCREAWSNKTPEQIEEIVKKRRNIFLEKYGADNPNKVESIKEKTKMTNIKKYGVENVFQNEDIKKKIRENNMEKYGVEYYSQTQGCRLAVSNKWKSFSDEKRLSITSKTKKTTLQRYGVDSYTKTDEYIEKTKKTNRERYGVDFSLQSKEVRDKAYQTFVKNGSMPCSIQQKHLHNVLGGELNYFNNRCFLDIAFPAEMIYIEYDGGGHDLDVKLGKLSKEEFERKEMKRYFALKNEGWKSIKIKSGSDMLPTDEELSRLIYKSKNLLKDYNWVEINLDKKILKTYDYVENLELKLRRIYKEKEVC